MKTQAGSSRLQNRMEFSGMSGKIGSFSKSFLSTTLALTAAGLLLASGAQADITAIGDFTPEDPASWTITDHAYIGNSGVGSLTVDGDRTISARDTRIGNLPGSTGTVTIDGPKAAWNITYFTVVGWSGTGVLNILNGGTVTSAGNVSYVGYMDRGNGTVTVDGAGSTWTNTKGLNVGEFNSGFLNILNGGKVSDTDSILGNYDTSTGTATVDGAGSTWTNSGKAFVGYNGKASLDITNGGLFNADGVATLGYYATGVGAVTVDGKNSAFTNGGVLTVGLNGTAELNILNGASATTGMAVIGVGATSNGAVQVASGSNWTVNGYLSVADYGTGLLSVSGGSSVATRSEMIIGEDGGKGIVAVDLGTGSSLSVASGSGTITNNGTIRLAAGAGVANGTYTPMSYSTMNGSGTVQALGGVWDSAAHTVAVNAASTAAGNGGAIASFNTGNAQQALITDSATGRSVGAGFQAGTADLTFGATAISGSELTSLQGLLADGKSVLSGWDFSTTGTTVDSTNPVYLSLWAGNATSLSDLTVWQYVSGAWSQYTGAYDLAYDGTYASFTATDLNTWAVTGTSPVPVPGAVWLLGSGLLGVLGFRKRGLKA